MHCIDNGSNGGSVLINGNIGGTESNDPAGPVRSARNTGCLDRQPRHGSLAPPQMRWQPVF